MLAADDSLVEKIEGLNVDETCLSGSAQKCEEVKEQFYKYITNTEEQETAVHEIENALSTEKMIAIDLEGANLSRAGTITLLAIATRSQVYLFDVLKLGPASFEKGLKEIFEDDAINKLLFDCREDSDALWHLFDVNLKGVLDIQLLEIIKQATAKIPSEQKKRNFRDHEIVRLESLISCMYHYQKDNDILRIKQNVERKIKFQKNLWEERPLSDTLLKYAAYDVKCLFPLYDTLKPDGEQMNRLRIASEVYCNTKRSMVMRRFNQYERNPYLPIDVIPEKGQTSFTKGNTKCTGCQRLFPRDEFSKNQLRKGDQLCRVCKMVKGHSDRQCPYLEPRLGPVPIIPEIEEKLGGESNQEASKLPIAMSGPPRFDFAHSRMYDDDNDFLYDHDNDYDDYDDRWNNDSDDDHDRYGNFRYTYENGLHEMEGGDGSSEWQFYY
ncbi:EXD1 [Mytilus coruscus]|uniref:EXD1 n=1 Tax=Mytilus coruscus TaxID=42192 RepID=A0A6J8ERQ7_MYTCO|nr:EXD1 [Mytilus coruscus]